MLKKVETLLTLKEATTDGHAPVLFHCSDGHNYFCKYRIWPNPEEINCLAFEIIASVLLKELDIPTPEIALITIAPGTLDSTIINKNQRMAEGMVVFGSREIKPVQVVDEFSINHTKYDYNKISNPQDLIRIALFDLWVKNGDRGREFDSGHNYNLLLSIKNNKQKIIAFDHAFIFGGSAQIGNFFPSVDSNINGNLYQTPYFQSVIKYIDKKEYHKVLKLFVTLLKNNYSKLVSETVAELPDSWNLIEDLDTKVNTLLGNNARIDHFADKLTKLKL